MKLIIEVNCNNKIGKKIKKFLHDYKVVIIRNSPTHDSFWAEQASEIGKLVPMKEDIKTGNKTGEFWTDIKYDAKLSHTFSHSNTRQPLHTDGSYESLAPNVTFFFCLKPAKVGGSTTCLDLDLLKKCLKIEKPDLLEKLKATEILFSKGNDFKTSKIINGKKCNWNYFRAAKSDLTEEFHIYLEQRIVQMGVLTNINLKKGDAVFFNDELILHGRNAFIGDRWLKKGGLTWSG